MTIKPLLAAATVQSVGVAIYLHSLSKGLDEMGIAHSVACGDDLSTSGIVSSNVATYRIEGLSARFHDLFSFRADFRNLRKEHFSFVHIVTDDSIGRPIKASRILRKSALLTVHRPVTESAHHLLKKPVKLLITSSEVVRESLVNQGGVPKAKIRVVPYIIDAEGLSTMAKQRNEVPVIGAVVEPDGAEEAEILIHTLSKLIKKGLSCHLLLIGVGERESSLRALAAESALRHNITFISSYLSHLDLLAAFDVYVFYSLRESERISVLFAAMAAGKPVVTTALNILQDVVEDGETALVIPGGGSDELTDALTRLLKDTELFNKLGPAASERVKEKFPMRRSIEALLAVYNELIEER